MDKRWVGRVVHYGKPKPQGSKVAVVRGGRALVVDACRDARSWRNDLTAAMRDVRPDQPYRCGMAVTLDVFVPRPKSHYGTGRNAGKVKPRFKDAEPISSPDIDKVLRAVLDAGKLAGWWVDDRQVRAVSCSREWAPDHRPFVRVFSFAPVEWGGCVEPIA